MLRQSSRVLLIVAMASLALLAACGKASAPAQNLAANQTLTIANTGVSEIATMDPALVTDLNSASVTSMTWAGLVGLDATTLAVKADLAQDLPTVANGGVTNNGATYTFKLRPNLKFSNGDPIDANVLAYSIDRALNPKLGVPAISGWHPRFGQGRHRD